MDNNLLEACKQAEKAMWDEHLTRPHKDSPLTSKAWAAVRDAITKVPDARNEKIKKIVTLVNSFDCSMERRKMRIAKEIMVLAEIDPDTSGVEWCGGIDELVINKEQKGKQMKSVYKYEIDPSNPCIELPAAAKILSAGVQGEHIFIWALVDIEFNAVIKHEFSVVGTGHSLSPTFCDEHVFLNTVFMGPLVFHVFERTAEGKIDESERT